MTSFIDPEFGEITIHKRRGSRSIHIKVGTDGRYVATVPPLTPVRYIKHVVETSRESLRKIAKNTSVMQPYVDGQAVGMHHTIAVVPTQLVRDAEVKILNNKLLVYLPPTIQLDSPAVQQQIRDAAVRILRREAKAYLPDALTQLATQHGFSYSRVRFSHAAGRWGSCSSTGTISLNIALMKLPEPLIQYVLIHELCHTRQMNHSPAFWTEVAAIDPHYKLHKRQIAQHTPAV